MDPEALNYTVDADEEGPCNFPGIALFIEHQAGNVPWNRNTVFLDALNHPYRIIDIKLLLSQLELTNASGVRFGIQDSVIIHIENHSSINASNDILINVGRNDTYTTGKFTANGSYTLFDLLIGVPEAWMKANPENQSLSHPLRTAGTYKLWNEKTGYSCGRVVLQKDTAQATTLDTLYLPGRIPLHFTGSFKKNIGNHCSIPMKLDFEKMMLNLNILEKDSTLQEKIQQQLQSAFSII